jgi:hypothetical protein
MATGTRDSLEKAGITPFYLVRQQLPLSAPRFDSKQALKQKRQRISRIRISTASLRFADGISLYDVTYQSKDDPDLL